MKQLNPSFCCPLCRGDLDLAAESYRCESCTTTYPVILGIPDFRVRADAYISVEDDRAKAVRLEQLCRDLSFADSVRQYWDITEHENPELVAQYIRGVLSAVARGSRVLGSLDRFDRENGRDCLAAGERVLDLGCGSGGGLVAAAARGASVVGCDVALRWLVIARKRLVESGFDGELVCANAEHLPFRGASFSRVLAVNLLEHADDAAQLLSEIERTLAGDCSCLLVTPNRLAPAPDPHFRLWGLGLLPDSLGSVYVRLCRGRPSAGIHLWSIFGLVRAARAAGYRLVRSGVPEFERSEATGLRGVEAWLLRLYNRVVRVPVLLKVLLMFGPVLELYCVSERRSPGVRT